MKKRFLEFVAWLRVCPLWYRDRETRVSFCWDNIDEWNLDVRNPVGLDPYKPVMMKQEVSILFTTEPFGTPHKPGPVVTVSFPPVKNK